jgi:hypothetical protein
MLEPVSRGTIMKKTVTLSLLCAIGALLLISGGTLANAQATPGNDDEPTIVIGPTVQSINDMHFGSLQRLNSRTIEYLDADAASFVVDVEPGRTIDLSVRVEDLIKPQEEIEDGLGRGKISLQIRQEDCAYSLDRGDTWQQFNTSLYNQEIKIPEASTPFFRLMVRVGGTIQVDHNQRKGDYLGRIIVEAEYK